MEELNKQNEKNFDGLTIKSNDVTVAEELSKLGESLDFPIKEREVWVGYDNGHQACEPRKYGYYYPDFGLLITTFEQDKRRQFLEVTSYCDTPKIEATAPKETSTDEDDNWESLFKKSVENDAEPKTSFFDDIDDNPHAVEDSIKSYVCLSNDIIDDFVKSNLPEDVQFASPDFNNRLVMHLFKELTSAKFHERRTALYLDSANNKSEIGYSLHLRMEEIFKLWGANIPNPNMENFAIVMQGGNRLPHIVYFHIDDATFKTHDLRQINKYLYNNESNGILPFFKLNEAENNYEMIPYEQWKNVLKEYPILVFGFNDYRLPDGTRYPILDFLGKYNPKEVDAKGNIPLEI